jgi:hypothetical protein
MDTRKRGGIDSREEHPVETAYPAGDDPTPDQPVVDDPRLFAPEEFRATFGETLAQTLDLGTWLPGEDLARLYETLETEIKTALSHESAALATIRRTILPRIAARPNAPAEAGVYRVTAEQIAHVHRAILFNGGVEAADGTFAGHDTLAATISQIGVCLVSYLGDSGSWVHHLYRRDFRATTADPIEEAVALIEQRQRRSGFESADRRGRLSDLAHRAILAYAERAVLLERSEAPWRMGHGNPVPVELLSGSGYMELLKAALSLLERLIAGHRKLVFVPSAPPDRGLLTIGNALGPLEYAVLDDMTERMRRVVEQRHYDAAHLKLAREFVEEFGPQLLIGVYRVSRSGPPQLFYAHRDHVHEAALIVLADSALQEHRSFPTLIDLADTLCRATFGPSDFGDSVQLAYLEAGHPYRYLNERQTRR